MRRCGGAAVRQARQARAGGASIVIHSWLWLSITHMAALPRAFYVGFGVVAWGTLAIVVVAQVTAS